MRNFIRRGVCAVHSKQAGQSKRLSVTLGKLAATVTIVGLTVLSSANAFAEHPSVDEVKGMVGKTWTGTIEQVNGHEDEKWVTASGHCQIKILSPTTVWIRTNHWRFHRQAVLTGVFGHSGNNPSAPVAFGGEKFSVYEQSGGAPDDLSDNGLVRLQWNSANEVEFQWWPSAKEQAGQKQHKPPYVSGKLKG